MYIVAGKKEVNYTFIPTSLFRDCLLLVYMYVYDIRLLFLKSVGH